MPVMIKYMCFNKKNLQNQTKNATYNWFSCFY